jgi:putative ABC transport system permease protein
MLLGGCGAVLGALLALAVSLTLYAFPLQMPPPPGSSRGYALNIDIDPSLYALTLAAMVVLATLASGWIARRTVHLPIVDALAHT